MIVSLTSFIYLFHVDLIGGNPYKFEKSKLDKLYHLKYFKSSTSCLGINYSWAEFQDPIFKSDRISDIYAFFA